MVSALTKVVQWMRPIGKVDLMIASRLVLGVISGLSWFSFQNAIRDCFGPACGHLFALLTFCQFHPLFYSSRTLPNTFALCLVLKGYASWIRGRNKTAIAWLTACSVIFRFEVAILLAGMFLSETFEQKKPSAQSFLLWSACWNGLPWPDRPGGLCFMGKVPLARIPSVPLQRNPEQER